jgi:hypothetical protein
MHGLIARFCMVVWKQNCYTNGIVTAQVFTQNNFRRRLD